MIFAPRSWPSRPGFAITTRIFLDTIGKYRDVLLRVIGSSPAWPNAGGAHSGYLVEGPGRLLLDCGPGVLSRLRLDEPWPRIDAIAITHLHLDHWGDLVPWVWGSRFRVGDTTPKPELWLGPGARASLRTIAGTLGTPEMFETTFELREYRPGERFRAAGFEVLPLAVPHYSMQTVGFRVESGGCSLAYSGDSAPGDTLVELARDVDLFVCEATLLHGELDGHPRGHLSAEEAVETFEAAGAQRLLLTHRPSELGLPPGLELAHDGLELEV